MTKVDTTLTVATKRRGPRQRAAAAGPATPRGYAKAREAFEEKAQQWLLSRPGRLLRMPDDLTAVAGLGVPCRDCGAAVYRQDTAGHTVSWRRDPRHWAAGITATCSA